MKKTTSYIFSALMASSICFGTCVAIVGYSNSHAVAIPEKIIFENLKEDSFVPPVEEIPEETEEPEVLETESENFPEEEIVEPIQEEEPIYYDEYTGSYYEEPISYNETIGGESYGGDFSEYSSSATTYIGNNFQSDGVWFDENRRYTWYSSNDAPHWQMGEWTPDDDGIYRDSEGYVVVASDSLEHGTVVEDTPFGAVKVYDTCGTAGTMDIYVNW